MIPDVQNPKHIQKHPYKRSLHGITPTLPPKKTHLCSLQEKNKQKNTKPRRKKNAKPRKQNCYLPGQLRPCSFAAEALWDLEAEEDPLQATFEGAGESSGAGVVGVVFPGFASVFC